MAAGCLRTGLLFKRKTGARRPRPPLIKANVGKTGPILRHRELVCKLEFGLPGSIFTVTNERRRLFLAAVARRIRRRFNSTVLFTVSALTS